MMMKSKLWVWMRLISFPLSWPSGVSKYEEGSGVLETDWTNGKIFNEIRYNIL